MDKVETETNTNTKSKSHGRLACLCIAALIIYTVVFGLSEVMMICILGTIGYNYLDGRITDLEQRNKSK